MKRVSIAKCFLVLLLVGVFLQCLTWIDQSSNRSQPFDPVVWREHLGLHDAVLHDQAWRLLSGQTLVGKTRAEVVELLGEPSRDRLPQGPRDPEESEMAYLLGPYRYFGAEWEWFLVRIGADGRVSMCAISRE